MAVVLALLPNRLARARLNSALWTDQAASERHQVVPVESWAEMRDFGLRSPVHVAIFDPYATGKLDLESARLTRRLVRSALVLIP